MLIHQPDDHAEICMRETVVKERFDAISLGIGEMILRRSRETSRQQQCSKAVVSTGTYVCWQFGSWLEHPWSGAGGGRRRSGGKEFRRGH